jgi:hypothetical protein
MKTIGDKTYPFTVFLGNPPNDKSKMLIVVKAEVVRGQAMSKTKLDWI